MSMASIRLRHKQWNSHSVTQLQMIATHESLYMYEQDVFAYEVAQAIESGVKLNDRDYEQQHDSHVLTANEWHTRFS